MRDVAITVEGLGKRYVIGERPGFGRWLMSVVRSAPDRRHRDPAVAQTGRSTIWAVRDVSFEIRQGEVVGVIGRNGAGKSTLLKLLSRIVRPDTGAAEIRGRVGSLLEVGTGFHPELTGRDNVFLSGAILGMKKAEIARKFDEIVGFAGVEKFIDTPVKHYSSGMYVRLAFAVAAHLEPEVLLVDEVLAVGDAAFQARCLERIGEVRREGRTVLFVSHNLGSIGRLCSRALWLDSGRLKTSGPCHEVISEYISSEASRDGYQSWPDGIARPGVTEFRLLAVRIRNRLGEVTALVSGGEEFSIEIDYELREPLPYCRVGVHINTADGFAVATAYDADDERYAGRRSPGLFTSRCTIPGQLLNPGRFTVSPSANILGIKHLAKIEHCLTLDVSEAGAIGAHMADSGTRRGVIRPKFTWFVEPCPDAVGVRS
jgi:lipopolysaccharide transport system ATP-binding protein